MTQAVTDTPEWNYFIRHWRGELPLATSFWINLILPSVVISAAWLFIAEFYGVLTVVTFPDIDFSASWWRSATIVGLIVLGVVTVWQIVGVRHAILNSPGGEEGRWGRVADGYLRFAGFERFFLAIAVFSIVFGAVDTSEIWITDDGEGIVFSGEITGKSAYEFKRLLEKTPSVRVVHLDSPGGIVGEARSMAWAIRQRKLDTSVPVA